MTVDVIELLSKAGAVEPVDQDVLEAALQKLAESAGHDARHPAARRRTRSRHPWLITAAAVAVVATAGSLAVVTRRGHESHAGSSPAPTSASAPSTSAGTTAPPTIAAIMTAFSASGGDVLKVTKTMTGNDGTMGKTVIWISPADAAPGSSVTSRIQLFALSGAPQLDMTLSYTPRVPSTPPAALRSDCGAIFARPRLSVPPSPAVPGTATIVNYLGHLWAKGAVSVQAATVPGPVALQACLKAGQWRVEAQEVLGGIKVTKLADAGGFEYLWVNSATLLPVQLVSSGQGVDTITFTFQFLPPTAANQASLNPPSIPAGFSEVSLSHGS